MPPGGSGPRQGGTRRRRRGLLGPAVVVALAAGVALVYVPAYQQMSVRGRVAYALQATVPLRMDIARFAEEHGRLPGGPGELGAGERRDYPDGGWFRLDDGGRIEIRFSVLPELTGGSLLVSPRLARDRALRWECRVVGSIDAGYLPAECRP